MGAKLSFKYDRDADILHIDKRSPYPEQDSEELGDDVIARLNPDTGEVENLEVLFFSTRLLRSELFELLIYLSRQDRFMKCSEILAANARHRSVNRAKVTSGRQLRG
jgi:uncharacterized protein YuzE